jgi:hypothetical protein
MSNSALSAVARSQEFTTPTTTRGEKSSIRFITGRAKLVLRSQIHGRERWYADALEDNPRLAAAVELLLRSEEGIAEVHANPLTGRVLVHYLPDAISAPVETLIRRAIENGPMSRDEYAALRSEQPHGSFSKQLLTAEIACSLSHVVLLGGLCPLGLAATGVLFFLHRRSGAHNHA